MSLIQSRIPNCRSESAKKVRIKIKAESKALTMYAVNVNGKVSAFKNLDSLKGNFDNLLLEAVDETLALLGDSCRHAVYFHLEKTFKIRNQDIPLKFEEFVNAIEQIFGMGAKIIEIQIMKCLHRKVGDFKYFPKGEDLTLIQYVNTVKTLELISKRSHINNAQTRLR